MAGSRMVHLTTVSGAFHAQVLAARLGADGVITELRGAVGGPYPGLGEVQVWVPLDEFELARDLLVAEALPAPDDAGGAGSVAGAAATHGGPGPQDGRPPTVRPAWLAPAVLAVVVVLVLARALDLFGG